MSATKEYFRIQIADALAKALGLPADIRFGGNGKIEIAFDPRDSDTPFWQAVAEMPMDKAGD